MSTAETQVDTQAPDGGEVVGVPSIGDAIGGLAAAFGQGRTVTREAAKLGGELVRVALGRSEVDPGKGDRRFNDPAWSGNPIFSRIERGYLATAQAVSNVVDELGDSAGHPPRRAGPLRHHDPHQRAVAHQLLRHQPGRAQARVRHRRHQPRARPAQLRRRRAQQRRHALDDRARRLRGRQGPRAHPRRRRAARRGRRVHPVPAHAPNRCTSGRWSSSRRRSAASTSSTCARAAASSSTPSARASRCS